MFRNSSGNHVMASAYSVSVMRALLIAPALGLATSNPWLTVASLAALPLFVSLLWRRGEPPILLFCAVMQWLQATMMVFHADFLNLDIKEMSESTSVETAAWLSLAGTALLSVGLFFGNKLVRRGTDRSFSGTWASPYSIQRLFYLYLLAPVFLVPLNYLSTRIPGLTQPLLAVANLQWIVLFLLAFTVFQRRRRYVFLVIALAISVGLGFLSFFASWKEPLFIVVLAYFTVYRRVSVSTFLKVAPVILMIACLAIVWTAVKKEYRSVYWDLAEAERGNKIAELVMELDGPAFTGGIEQTAERIGYIHYFALVLDRVPLMVPHENGVMWRRAVTHVLMPRIFFPNKERLVSDSVTTMRYTGQWVSGATGGTTSIGVGYFAESYIDFGTYFMFVPVFVLGMIVGAIYGYFVSRTKNPFFGAGAAVAIFSLNYISIASSNVKIFGAILMGFIVLALVERFVFHRVHRYLTLRAGNRRRYIAAGGKLPVQKRLINRGAR